ncbi:MAG: hypothetical protein U0133_10145 [Gemmatimonadales bacterium]
MIRTSLIIGGGLLAALHLAARPAHADDLSGVARWYMAEHASTAHSYGAEAMPPFARKYGVACTTCHWPVPPKLNGFGQRFRWRGYRMENEVNQPLKADDVKNHLGVRAIAQGEYVTAKGADEPLARELSNPTLSVFYVGAIGKRFGGWFEVGAYGDVLAQVSSIWGNPVNYGGIRAGKILWLTESGVAGFDRVVLPSQPLPLSDPLTNQVPLNLAEQKFAVEGYLVRGRDTKVSATLLNGYNLDAEGGYPEDKKFDVALSAQHLFGARGSGIMATFYRGAMGLRPDSLGQPVDITAHYERYGLSGNAILGNAELLVGGVMGRDHGYAASGSLGKGWGFWGSALYNFPQTFLHAPLAIQGRYEYVNRDTQLSGQAVHRYVVGAALPLTDPYYLRLRVEYNHDHPTSGIGDLNGVRVQADLAW